MSDNWLVVAITLIVALLLGTLVVTGFQNNQQNRAGKEETEQTRINACKTIEDTSLRTLCINNGPRP